MKHVVRHDVEWRRKDGTVVRGEYATYDEAWVSIHKASSGNSVDWLMKYEGWTITEEPCACTDFQACTLHEQAGGTRATANDQRDEEAKA